MRLFRLCGVPEGEAQQNRAAQQVAQGDPQQVPAHGGPVRAAVQQGMECEIGHVGDGVLQSGEDEGGDGQGDHQGLGGLALEAEAERHGVRYVYMPMGKGPEAAEAGESPLFFGGSKDVYERDKAFLSDIGEVFYLGDVKAACAFKLITNLIGLSNNVILTEGVFLAKRMGLSEEAFLNGAKSTGAWSYQMRNSGHKVFAEAFLPMRGTLDNAWKDMKFGVEMAEEAGVSCPAFAMLRDRYKAASEAGYGEEDYISVYRLLMDAENDGATAAEPCN